MILEYLDANALNKYPFKDLSTLTDSGHAFTFSNDWFLDIIFTAKTGDVEGAFLYSYQNQYSSSQFVIVFKTIPTGTAITLTIPYASVIDKGLITYADGNVAIKIVPGHAFVSAKSPVDVALHIFLVASTTLVSSAVIRAVPRVTSLAFYNWDSVHNAPFGSSEFTFTGNETSPLTNLTISGGANINFELVNSELAIDLIRGEGTGPFDACADSNGAIRTINFIGPATTGNFLLETDDCYTTTDLTNGLELINSCTPKCSSQQINDFAHYDNRIVDGMTTLFTFAESVYDTIKNEIDRYVTDVVPTLNKPHYKAAITRSPAIIGGHGYLTIGIGFFNPTSSPVTANVTTTGGTLAAHSPGPRTFDQAVPCLQHLIMNVTLYGTIGTTITVAGTFGALTVNYSNTI